MHQMRRGVFAGFITCTSVDTGDNLGGATLAIGASYSHDPIWNTIWEQPPKYLGDTLER